VIVHLWRGRNRDCARLGKEPHLVAGSRCDIFEPALIILCEPVGDQLIDRCGLDDGPGKDMCSNLSRLLEQEDPKVFVSGFGCELLEPNCGTQPGRTC
jgi:hypothetical protein